MEIGSGDRRSPPQRSRPKTLSVLPSVSPFGAAAVPDPLHGLSLFHQFFATAAVPCPYVEGRAERKLIVELSGRAAPLLFDELSRAGFRRSHQFAYRPACRRFEREPTAIIRKARRVVHRLPGHETLGAAICDRHARDRLIEHVLAASERAVVGFEVDRLAVLRPHKLVHPRIVHREPAHRAASRRHDRETAR